MSGLVKKWSWGPGPATLFAAPQSNSNVGSAAVSAAFCHAGLWPAAAGGTPALHCSWGARGARPYFTDRRIPQSGSDSSAMRVAVAPLLVLLTQDPGLFDSSNAKA